MTYIIWQIPSQILLFEGRNFLKFSSFILSCHGVHKGTEFYASFGLYGYEIYYRVYFGIAKGCNFSPKCLVVDDDGIYQVITEGCIT